MDQVGFEVDLFPLEGLEFAGAGRWRGVVGMRREMHFPGSGEVVTVAKKTTSPPCALEGGAEANPNSLVAYPDTPREQRVSTKRVPVEPGDRFRVIAAGGGGRGDARLREPERVREDVLDGSVSERAASELYGVNPKTWTRT